MPPQKAKNRQGDARLGAVPVQAATMSGGGEEEVWLAQGEALRDPRPDVPHLLYGDNLRGEVVRIESQVHILSAESKEMARLSSKIMIEHLVMLMHAKT